VGVGVTAIFGQGALAAERLRDARQRGRTGDVLVNGLVVALAGLVCLGALVIGLIAMTHSRGGGQRSANVTSARPLADQRPRRQRTTVPSASRVTARSQRGSPHSVACSAPSPSPRP
jgi:hypothetical protein